MDRVDEILLAQPETEYVFTTSGGFLFANITSENALRGSSTINLKPGSNVSAFVDRVNAELGQLPLVDTLIRISPASVRGLILSNSPVRSDIDIALQGQDTQAIVQAGQQVMAAAGWDGDQAPWPASRHDAEAPQVEASKSCHEELGISR